ncbi:uncharacterized protein PAC_14821 [Phialocephala subalpina]|uniref:NAD(P)-binding protein n=1 Tax=Phialocephala subalpina TaxID=576137 RepID=A0A1L7XIR3_9HELO|nr:uncharacterized protein PAC_14821 [Phialocephala subalpina]
MSQPNFTHAFTRKVHKAPTPAISPDNPPLSAEGKTILITAGATGIGLSVATAFAAAHASNLILLSRRESVLLAATEELKSAYPATKVYTYPCDVTDQTRVQEVFKDVKSKIGDLDIVVSSHAPFQKPYPVVSTPTSVLVENFNSTVLGNVNLINTLLETFPPSAEKEKIFINISSVASHVQIPTMAAYASAKASILALLQHYHMEHAPSGLRIHSLHPGAHWTVATKEYGVPENMMQWDDRSLPGRFVLWLASDKGKFLGGRFVHANWDTEELEQRKGEFEKDPE